jgi:hypothetical protein
MSTSPPEGKKQELIGVRKVIERDPAWSWPYKQLKLPQWRYRNHRVGDSELRSINHCVSLSLLSALSSSSIVIPRYILWCALLISRYCVYPSLNISRSSLHIFCELDCLLREIILNSLLPIRPVWYTSQTGLDWLIAFKVCKFQGLPIHPPLGNFQSDILVLLVAIGVVFLVRVPLGCLYPFFYIQGGRGYKEGNRVSYNMIPIRTLSLLPYFTYIFIDISINALGSMPYSPLDSSGWWAEL